MDVVTGEAPAEDEAVAVEEFFAGLDVADGVNEDLFAFLNGLAVRRTGVVDVASDVALPARIEDVGVRDVKKFGVSVLFLSIRVPLYAFAFVFDDLCSARDSLECENAHAVNG